LLSPSALDYRHRNVKFVAILGLVASLTLLAPAVSGQQRARPEPAQTTPKLVVLVVMDQFTSSYIDLYSSQWTRGLRRLLDQGAVFRNAAYPYGMTVTCPGHTTIGTGTLPSTHGLVANSWYDRDSDQTVTCESDPTVMPVVLGAGTTTGKHSARLMKVPTFADELRRQATRPPNIVSIAEKPRSAIGMAGHGGPGTVVIWEGAGGAWSSSTAYTDAPWPDADAFVRRHPIAEAYGDVWTKMLPESQYRFTDDNPAEAKPTPWGRTFPHSLQSPNGPSDPAFVTTWQRSPWADVFVTDFAIHMLRSRHLGREQGTDMLAVSLGSLDVSGHQYGPHSHEVQDVLARADQNIGRLLEALDREVGQGNYVLAFSADHGVTRIPEDLLADGEPGGRFSSLSALAEQLLLWSLGPGKKVGLADNAQLALTKETMAALRANPAAEEQFVSVLKSAPGTAKVFRAADLASTTPTTDPDLRAWRLSYVAGRTGDYVIVPKPGYYFAATGTGHGSQNDPDQRVPLILFGRGVKPGQYQDAASPADIAPTFASVTNVSLPTAQGRVLQEALSPRH
jgi:predicted AlkP superfamily pyrophosphatase or phosphodiesterase